MSQESVEIKYQKMLGDIVNSQVKGISFTDGARDLLDSIIRDGAKRLVAEKALVKQEDLAQGEARRLGRNIAEDGKRAGSRVDKSRLSRLLGGLCPIYPFCR